jgi:predicted nucleotidyltransferase
MRAIIANSFVDGTHVGHPCAGTHEDNTTIPQLRNHMQRLSERIRANRDAIKAIVTRHRGVRPRVFGSVARGDDTPQSDGDLLVDLRAGTGLFALGAMQYELQDLLQTRVDVLTPQDLPAAFRAQVLAEACPL